MCKLRPARLFGGRAFNGAVGAGVSMSGKRADYRLFIFAGIKNVLNYEPGGGFREDEK